MLTYERDIDLVHLISFRPQDYFDVSWNIDVLSLHHHQPIPCKETQTNKNQLVWAWCVLACFTFARTVWAVLVCIAFRLVLQKIHNWKVYVWTTFSVISLPLSWCHLQWLLRQCSSSLWKAVLRLENVNFETNLGLELNSLLARSLCLSSSPCVSLI